MPALTRRQDRLQKAILNLTAGDLYYYPGWQSYRTKPGTNPSAGMCAYFFAKKWQGRAIDFYGLQRVVLYSNYPEAAFLFARDVRGANVRRLQKVVLYFGSPQWKRRFAAEIPGASAAWLESMAIIQEVMEG